MTKRLRWGAAVLGLAVLVGCSNETTSPPEADSPSRYARRARAIVDQIVAGEYARVRADFNASMKEGLSEAQIREGWNQYQSLFGRYQSQGEPDVFERGSVTVVHIPLNMSKKRGEAQISFDVDGKIAGLFLRPAAAAP